MQIVDSRQEMLDVVRNATVADLRPTLLIIGITVMQAMHSIIPPIAWLR